MPDKVIRIGLMGLGTVGRGVYRILKDNSLGVRQKVGAGIEIKKILVRDPAKSRDLNLDPALLTTDYQDIIGDPEIDLVVELIGGVDQAFPYGLAALKEGKSLITANKDMIALYGKELFETAEAHRAEVLFEASVAGGVPIIRPLKECLAANRIQQVIGIINGTTNYMLTRMTEEGLDFQEVLREAQTLGYAEADPSADVEGYDAARKLAILSSIAFNVRVPLEKVFVEGITKISAVDIAYAGELHCVVKLLGIAKETDEGLELRVHPALLAESHPLAAVNDVYNAIFIRGDAVGDVMFYGRGAGELPTASAVVADVMSAARHLLYNVPGIVNCTCFEEKSIKPMGTTLTKYYVRLQAVDKPKVLAGISSVFGDNEVSLASVIQKQNSENKAEIVLVTHEVWEENLQKALQAIKELATVYEITSVIRVEED